MYLLDTDTLTHLHFGNSNVTERLKSATLVTRNLRHFKQIPGLKVENWVDR